MWLNPWHLTLKFENSLGGDAKMPARLALLAARRAPPKGSKGQCGLDPTTCRVPGRVDVPFRVTVTVLYVPVHSMLCQMKALLLGLQDRLDY